MIAQNGLLWSDLQDYYPRALSYFVGAGSRLNRSRRSNPA